MTSFKFFNSWEYQEFYKFCENNNKLPTPMLKRLMRLCVILDADLSDEHKVSISLNTRIKGY